MMQTPFKWVEYMVQTVQRGMSVFGAEDAATG
jgi:hypothetical protein